MSFRSLTPGVCADCRTEKAVGFDHVHQVPALPRKRSADDHVVQHGYVTQLEQLLVFFFDFEPAFVFGRAGRQSLTFTSWRLYAAAKEIRFDYQTNRDVHTLYVDFSTHHSSYDNERPTLARWVEGTTPASSSYLPGARRRGAPTH